MKFKSKELLNELFVQTEANRDFVITLKSLNDETLNKRLHENSWSILECLQHLNLYGNYYLKEIFDKMMIDVSTPNEYFNSGFLGNYFAQSMLPKQKPNKMKTFKSMNPIHSNLDRSVIDIFIDHQNTLLTLLEKAKNKNIEKIKTNISLTKLIKLRLGDTFRFLINHNIRHIQQMKNILIA